MKSFHEINDNAIIQAILRGKKPAGYVNKIDESILQHLESLHFSVRQYQETGSSFPVIVISRSGAVKDVIDATAGNLFSDFGDFDFYDRLFTLIQDIRNLSITEAVIFLLTHIHYVRCAEFAVCAGLLFGYPICCIRYFVETRHIHKFYPRLDGDDDNAGRVLCNSCRKLWRAESR